MDLSTVFAIIVLAVLGLAWASGEHILQKIGLLLLVAWSGSNLAVSLMGFSDAPLMIPSLDTLIAIFVALTGYRRRSVTALVVVAIYAIVGLVHAAALALRMQETYTYYAALNLLFLAQLSVVGGVSAWMAVHSRNASGGERARYDAPRPAHPG